MVAYLPGAGQQSTSTSSQASQNLGWSQQGSNQASQQTSTSFIPDYSQTPILNEIAQYARNMAPQVYQWGMDQYARNQGNIDNMMRTAQTYASPQRIKSEMGMAEAGVTQAGEQARQAATRDLESYGIDPSSGRYAALDQASRVQTAAAAAGAGNQQRMATEAAGTAMENQALSMGLQNTQIGYGAANALTGLLNTGMSLKYSPLGTTSQGTSAGGTTGMSENMGWSSGSSQQQSGPAPTLIGSNTGGGITHQRGGFISQSESPTHGKAVDDVQARLTAGEFVIPKEVVDWKGKEFFSKLIAQVRKQRATEGAGHAQPQTGYAMGGGVAPPQMSGPPGGWRGPPGGWRDPPGGWRGPPWEQVAGGQQTFPPPSRGTFVTPPQG